MQTANLKRPPDTQKPQGTSGYHPAKPARRHRFDDVDSDRQLELFKVLLFEIPHPNAALAAALMIGAQAASSPDVADLAGFTGPASTKPAERGPCQATNPGTLNELPADSLVAPASRADGNVEGKSDAPFAPDVDHAHAASVPAGGDEVDDNSRDTAEMHRGCPEQPPRPERVGEFLDDAPDGTGDGLPHGYQMTSQGLFFSPEPIEKNPEPSSILVAAPFRLVGETRSDTGEDWGVFLRWQDREGRPHEWAIPRRLIHRQGNEIAEELERAGLSCGPDARAHELLKRFIGSVKVLRLLRCVTSTGWHIADDACAFVLPGGEAFGRGAADVILQADHAGTDAAYRVSGTLSGWQSGIAALAVGNDRLAFFVSAAFAGPLLEVLNELSGGIHLVGDSRSGKSTLMAAAASVWGRPTADAQIRPWRGTANGLEGAAAETSDTLLILDEMGQADAGEVADVVYMLTNESGKQRASRTGAARRRQSWRTLFLSTGEISLRQKMGEAGKQAMAGLDVRLPNLPADAGAGFGVFQALHGRPNAAVLAEELKTAARTHYGIAARIFLTRLAEDRAADSANLRITLEEMRTRFIAKYVPDGVDGQVRSVASRFALIAAAGELARDYGIVPWPAGEATRAAGACFADWLAERGDAGCGEDAAALAQVRQFIEAHGESRFTLLVPPEHRATSALPAIPRVTANRAGFRRWVADNQGERWEYLVLPEAWKRDVCRGLEPKRTSDLLAKRGFLLDSTKRHRAAVVTIPGEGKRRVYVLSGAILADDTTNCAVRWRSLIYASSPVPAPAEPVNAAPGVHARTSRNSWKPAGSVVAEPLEPLEPVVRRSGVSATELSGSGGPGLNRQQIPKEFAGV